MKKQPEVVSRLVADVHEAEAEAYYAVERQAESDKRMQVLRAVGILKDTYQTAQWLAQDMSMLRYWLGRYILEVAQGKLDIQNVPVNECGQFQAQLPKIEMECGQLWAMMHTLSAFKMQSLVQEETGAMLRDMVEYDHGMALDEQRHRDERAAKEARNKE